MRSFLYYLYERRLLRQVRGRSVPQHLGIIIDGNRRYALEQGVPDLREAYALGAERLDDVLEWCAEVGIPAVSLCVLDGQLSAVGDGDLGHPVRRRIQAHPA